MSHSHNADLVQMAQFKHENVVNLIGVCTSGMPFMLIVQFCEHGRPTLDVNSRALTRFRRIELLLEGIKSKES